MTRVVLAFAAALGLAAPVAAGSLDMLLPTPTYPTDTTTTSTKGCDAPPATCQPVK